MDEDKIAADSLGMEPPGSTLPEARLKTAYLRFEGDLSSVWTPVDER